MNVISMMYEIVRITNPMIGESALPDFLVAPDDRSEFMRVRSFDQLDCTFNRDFKCGRQKKMNVLRHRDKSLQSITPFATIAIKRFQENPNIDLDDKQFTPLEGRERYEVSTRRGDESSRLQERTSAAGSRASLQTLNWHEWNSCPSRWFFVRGLSFWERNNG